MRDAAAARLRSALVEVVGALEASAQLDEAREAAGESMVRRMQLAFPVAAKIQAEVIARHGFPADGRGSVAFTELVKIHSKEDPEIARLRDVLREHFVPSLTR